MKLISHEDILNLNLDALMCYEWVKEMLFNKSKSILPPKISLKPNADAFFNIMPSLLYTDEEKHVGGLKIVSRFPSRTPSLDSKILLFDTHTGDIFACMDGNWITAMRTGAVAAHSIELFSKKNYSTVGIIGLGNVARATICVLSKLVKNREITIKLLKHKGQEVLFKDRFKENKNLKFEYAESYADVISESDTVISAVSYFENDICSDNYFHEGITVIPIHTRGFGNCDLFFDKVYADDKGHICHFKYFNEMKKFAEVSDVLNKNAVGRESDKERILVYNIGISIHDINFASKIYDLIDKRNIKEYDFKEPSDKFWM